MCGIAGTLGLSEETAQASLLAMRRALNHRGPDDQGIEYIPARAGSPGVGLAHTRLAIVDLSPAGHQPMAGPSRGTWIVFNGEIYNFRELGRELLQAGATFCTRTDTEVILRAYEAFGVQAVERLRGMFAFCLVDPGREIVLLCRDRLGQKPIYTVRPPGGGLLFASEVRALLAVGAPLVPRRVDPAAVASFLAQGMVCGTRSIVEGITLLPAATILVTDFEGREIQRRRYWTVPPTDDASGLSYGNAVERLRDTLRQSVEAHLVADVPLGLFLSSGIDSTAIATVATEICPSKVHTITIGFDDPAADESRDAGAIAGELGTEHRTVRIRAMEILHDVQEVFRAMDQPTVDGFNSYFVSRAARRAGLTVALSGVGGDELFGGYASFRDVPRAVRVARATRLLRRAKPWLVRLARLSGGRRGAKLAETLERAPDLVGAYLLRRELFLLAERDELGARSRASDATTGLPNTALEELRALVDPCDLVNSVSRLEISSYMRDMLLRDSDTFSMACSLEVRAPLLDDRVIEVVSRFPGRWKRARPHPKKLLIDAIGRRLPRSVLGRPKRGFTFPWTTWLRGPLGERARGALQNGDAWRTIGLDPKVPDQLWRRFAARDGRIGGLQMIALWILGESVVRLGLHPAE
jgi:asparagine synthase (glutamine-hydrolysing)